MYKLNILVLILNNSLVMTLAVAFDVRGKVNVCWKVFYHGFTSFLVTGFNPMTGQDLHG